MNNEIPPTREESVSAPTSPPPTTRSPLEMLSVSFAIVIAGGLIGAGIYFGNTKTPGGGTAAARNAAGAEQQNTQGAQGSAADDDPSLGNPEAAVTVIEFSDFQCPFCRRFWVDTLPKIKTNYIDAGKIRFVYRDFPLSFHESAKIAAESGECADDQGKFWEMHDAIFREQETQAELSKDNLSAWAKNIGLDMARFNECLNAGTHSAEVDKDFADGQAAGVSGTPTLFINGKIIVGAQPYSEFEKAIEKALGATQ